MKKKLIFIILLILVGGCVGIVVINCNLKVKERKEEEAKERYAEIIKIFSNAMDKHIEAAFINRDDFNCKSFIRGNMTSDTLIETGYIKRNDMLDVDGKSYCKAIATKYIVPLQNVNDKNVSCEMKYKVYIKCKNFETPDFNKQLYKSFSDYTYTTTVY